MRNIEKAYKKLLVCQEKLCVAEDVMNKILKDKVRFTAFVNYQHSDGFVLVYDIHNAPLKQCLNIIKDKGYLDMIDYEYLKI